MKTLFLFLSICAGTISAAAPAWNPIELSVSANFFAVKFYDPLSGYAIGTYDSSTILAFTSNAGESWSYKTFDEFKARAIEVFSANVIYIGGTDLRSNRAGIIYTLNAGETWGDTRDWLITNATVVNSLSVNNNNEILAVCDKGIIIHTTDNFQHYQSTSEGSDVRIDFVSHLTPNTAIAVAGPTAVSMNRILKSQGGVWGEIRNFAGDSVIAGMEFTGNGRGFIAVNSGFFAYRQSAILSTADGGETWQTNFELPDESGDLKGIHFSSANNGVAFTTAGKLFTTTNAGGTWQQEEETVPVVELNDIYFISPGYGFAVGNYGEMYRHGSPLEIEHVYAGNNQLSIYPNPVNTELSLYSVDGIGARNIKVYDQSGREINLPQPQATANATLRFDMSALENGIYYLKTSGTNASGTVFKFIKQ